MKKAVFEKVNWKNWNISIPLIQGGMGVGVSLSGLAGAVAKEGGMGVISTAQIGYDDPNFAGNESECNLKVIHRHIKRAKEIAQGKQKIKRCYHCIKNCNPAEIPYCITNALVNAVKGDIDHGLIFCGANVGRVSKISSVHEVVEDLMYVRERFS